jgi:integrase
MSILHLTKANIASLPAIKGKWRDTEIKGFTYKQTKTGKGSFFIQYRFEGKQRKYKIEDSKKISVDAARKIAFKLFGQKANGVDPMAVREAARRQAAKKTFAEVVAEHLAQKEASQSYLKSATLYLTGAKYFGTLHRKPIDSITNADIAPCLDRIIRDTSAATAGLARAHLSSFFEWVICRPFGLKENPVIRTEAPKVKSKPDRYLSADEIRTVWNACGDDDYGRVVKLLILTGCRREEIGSARWSWINRDAGTITLPPPAEVTDGRGEFRGTKNRKPLTLPLSDMAREIIDSIPRDGDFLFGARGEGFKTWGYSKAALLKATGEMVPWRIHDVRHTVSTGMHEIGILPHVVEAVLNHKSGHKAGVAGRYNHAEYREPMRDASVRWADYVQSVVTGKPAKFATIQGRAA